MSQSITKSVMSKKSLFTVAKWAEISTDVASAISGSTALTITLAPGSGFPINVDLNFAVPFGLLLNELVTNAVEHAFPAESTGTIRVQLSRAHGIELVVEDDGAGLPRESAVPEKRSLGPTIVYSLVEQLSGTIRAERGNGTHRHVVFPEPHPTSITSRIP